jgi:hypothetical protein
VRSVAHECPDECSSIACSSEELLVVRGSVKSRELTGAPCECDAVVLRVWIAVRVLPVAEKARDVEHARERTRNRAAVGLQDDREESRLQNLYPNAKFHSSKQGFWPAGWWLVKRPNQFGTAGFYPGLLAHMHDGRVQAFHVRYAAGGD